MKNFYKVIFTTCLIPNFAFAQALSPENIAKGFTQAIEICAKALSSQVPISKLGQAEQDLIEPADASMREFARIEDGRPVYSLKTGKGIVIVFEPNDGECNAMAYGPRVLPVFSEIDKILNSEKHNFKLVKSENIPEAYIREYQKKIEGNKIARIYLDGGEPGMKGRAFRFPLMFMDGKIIEEGQNN